jgi:hypothetical protein
MEEVFQSTGDQLEYRHDNGEISQVFIDLTAYGLRKFRIACLLPEAKEHTIKESLPNYGEVKFIKEELWTSAY